MERVYYQGENDGIYIIRFDDRMYRVAWCPNIEDIESNMVFSHVDWIPVPGTKHLRQRDMAQRLFNNIWFGTAPVFDTIAEALKEALRIEKEEFPKTQHGIRVWSGVYDKPQDYPFTQSERKEIRIEKGPRPPEEKKETRVG